MTKKISRRSFFNRSLGLSAGALLTGRMGLSLTTDPGRIPLSVTSHTNETGKKAMEAGWGVLQDGGSAVDA
ncbi:MAG: hypothetical protein MUP70_16940, partial [Candidatus Aminicenantes bacterium]|nr:hypothetical protein [Candidatus Aminicenantes bacterium]